MPAAKVLVMKHRELAFAVASGSAVAAEEATLAECPSVRNDRFTFLLCEWQDTFPQALVDELKRAAVKVREDIQFENTLEHSIKEVRKIQTGIQQPQLFQTHTITQQIKDSVACENWKTAAAYAYETAMPINRWRYDHLPEDASGNFVTYYCTYGYEEGRTQVLSQRAQIGLLAHAAILNAADAKMRSQNRPSDL